MPNYKVKSFAKINLGLRILDKRLDNFHNINSVFIRISLHDILEFIPSSKFNLECNNQNVPINNENTIYKAYNILNSYFPFKNHYTIKLNKLIPLESGMGGGSSNAAFTLNTLNQLNNLNLSKKELITIGLQIGSDVPFFINEEKIKLVSGRGEIFENFNSRSLNSLYFLLVYPKFSISTKWAYKKIKKTLDHKIDSTKFPALDEEVNWKLFENDFEEIVGSTYPEIFEIKEFLNNNRALFSSLSGTGSTVFGVYNNIKFIKEAQNKLNNYNTLIVSPT